jgi:hypothetical protein
MIVIMVVMCGVAYVSGVDVVVMAVAMLMLMYCLQLRLARTHANNGICYLLVIGDPRIRVRHGGTIKKESQAT